MTGNPPELVGLFVCDRCGHVSEGLAVYDVASSCPRSIDGAHHPFAYSPRCICCGRELRTDG